MTSRRAIDAYREFTGHEPDTELIIPIEDGDIPAYALGKLEGVAYEATRDGKTEKYFHEFGRKARPLLAVKDDGKQLFIAGGAYEVTDRGIEDVPAQLLVVNPSVRPSRRRKGHKGKSIMRRRYAANPRPRRRRRSYHSNPVSHRRRRRVSYRRNPAPRRRRSHSYRRNPIVHRRRYRRNPSGGGRGMPKISHMILPAAMIAAGAIGTEMVQGMLPLPTFMTTGAAQYATKGLLGIGLGMAVGKFFNRKAGEAFAMGSMVIAMHDLGKAMLAGMPLSLPGAIPGTTGVGYYNPAMLGEHMSDFSGMGEHVPAFDDFG